MLISGKNILWLRGRLPWLLRYPLLTSLRLRFIMHSSLKIKTTFLIDPKLIENLLGTWCKTFCLCGLEWILWDAFFRKTLSSNFDTWKLAPPNLLYFFLHCASLGKIGSTSVWLGIQYHIHSTFYGSHYHKNRTYKLARLHHLFCRKSTHHRYLGCCLPILFVKIKHR